MLAWWSGAFALGALVVFFFVAGRLTEGTQARDLIGSAVAAVAYAAALLFAASTWPEAADTFCIPVTLAMHVGWVVWVGKRINEKFAFTLGCTMGLCFALPLLLLLV